MVTILPAIDLKGGQCVRLRQGRADEATVYGDDPVEMARRWTAQGARWIHVVDLDGAFRGQPAHAEVIARMAGAVGIPIEVGGGIRTRDDIGGLIQAGVRRVILGTKACAEPQAIAALAAEFGEGLAVGIDARDGLVQVRGWVETTGVRAVDLARRMAEAGVRTLIYTDTATDGMLKGPNLKAVAELCGATGVSVIASGGVSSASDVRALGALGCRTLRGVIVGKALYDGRVTLADLHAAAAGV